MMQCLMGSGIWLCGRPRDSGYGEGKRMNVDLVFKIAAFGIILSVMSQLLTRAGREDIATLTTLAGLAIVMLVVVGLLSDFFTSVRQMFNLY